MTDVSKYQCHLYGQGTVFQASNILLETSPSLIDNEFRTKNKCSTREILPPEQKDLSTTGPQKFIT